VSLIKRSADLVYAFRFLRILTTEWTDLDAYKLGIIDDKGNRIRSNKITTREEKNAYTSFMRLAFNIKRLLDKAPGKRLASFASALYLIREKYALSDHFTQYLLSKINIDPLDLMNENTQWFMIEENRLSPGIYKVTESKALNEGYEQLVQKNDRVRIVEGYPVGEILGLDVYEAIHLKTNKPIYVTAAELMK
jgi:hypothetical protein